MPTPGTITEHFDIAFISLYVFWLFFAFLVFWLHRESKREGYPLVTDRPDRIKVVGFPAMPPPKTFITHDGHSITVPRPNEVEPPVVGAVQAPGGFGAPLIPTGNPMVDGVGPASWVPRRDEPELDGHGHNKIVPMARAEGFTVSAGRDPRGLPVQAGDLEVVGRLSDIWVDAPEQLVRYIEVELNSGAKRLVPMTLARIWEDRVRVNFLASDSFDAIPATRSSTEVTKLEEDKISAYVAAGWMYDAPKRKRGF
jgi:photosynthetic reaction center H subunit